MKNIIHILGAILLGSLLVLAGCSNALENPPNGGAVGTLLLQIGGVESNARTLGPDTSGFSYELRIQGSNGALIEESITGGTKTLTLSVGQYTDLTVIAYTGTGTDKKAVAKKNYGSFEIQRNHITAATIYLHPIVENTESGTLNYTLTFEDVTINEQSELTIKALHEQGTSPDYGSITIKIFDASERARQVSLPPGEYRLTITAETDQYLDSTPLTVYRTEVAHIFPGLTTKADFTFTKDDVSAKLKLFGRIYQFNYTSDADYRLQKVYIKNRSGDVSPIADAAISDVTINGGNWEVLISNYNNVASDGTVSLQFGFISSGKEIKTKWHPITVDSITGNTGNDLSANIPVNIRSFSFNSSISNGTITTVNKDTSNANVLEAVEDSEVQLEFEGDSGYGYLTGTLSGSVVVSYPTPKSFIMPNQDISISAEFVANTTSYSVGDEGPAGGVIFYIAKNDAEALAMGGKYLEVAPSDTSSTSDWSNNTSNPVGTTKTDIGSGKQNTAAIFDFYLKSSGSTYGAVTKSLEYSNTGTTTFIAGSWFLPSLDELTELLGVMNAVSFTPPSGFTALTSGTQYWTSSEANSSFAYYCKVNSDGSFSTGMDGKGTSYNVRPIHAFSIE